MIFISALSRRSTWAAPARRWSITTAPISRSDLSLECGHKFQRHASAAIAPPNDPPCASGTVVPGSTLALSGGETSKDQQMTQQNQNPNQKPDQQQQNNPKPGQQQGGGQQKPGQQSGQGGQQGQQGGQRSDQNR